MFKNLNSRDINILKNKYKRILILKFKIKRLLLKSIFFNRNINCDKRNLAYFFINQEKYIYKKYYNICKYSGYSRGLNSFTGFGRHELNRVAILGKLQNLNINSW